MAIKPELPLKVYRGYVTVRQPYDTKYVQWLLMYRDYSEAKLCCLGDRFVVHLGEMLAPPNYDKTGIFPVKVYFLDTSVGIWRASITAT